MNESSPANCSCPENILDTWSSLLEKYIIPTLGCLGLLSNLTAILVLRCRELKSTFHQSLLTLAICDIFLLIFIMGEILIDVQNVIYIYIFPYFWNPLKNIVMSWETFLIMSIATERFLVVCRPLLYRRHRLRCSSLIHLLTFILPGLLCAIIINVPKFFEVEHVFYEDKVDFKATALRMDEDYIYFYTHWTRLLATGIVPFLYLVFTNTIIIIQIRRGEALSDILRQNTNKSLQLKTPKPMKPQRLKFSNHSAVTLTMIVLIYMMCNLPRLVLNLVEYTLLSEMYKLDDCGCLLVHWWISSMIRISHFLLAINSSVNFLIYFLSSKPFKKLLEIKIQNILYKWFGIRIKFGN